MWGFLLASFSGWSAPLKCISGISCGPSLGVIIIYATLTLKQNLWEPAHNRLLVGQLFDILTSNQVGLPAELKHINKRRKRN